MEISMNSPLRVDELLYSAHSNKKTGGHQRCCSEQQVPAKTKNPFAAALHVAKTPFLMMQVSSALKVISSDDREIWVKLGHAAKTLDEDGGDEGKQAWLDWSRESHKFDPDDAERVWESLTPTNT